MKRFVFALENVLHVIRIGITSNAKIADPKEVIVQTYHFDLDQYNFVLAGKKGTSIKTGFINPDLTAKNCGNCPLRFGGCYTHKFSQAMGHLGMLRSIAKQYGNNLPKLADININELLAQTNGKYVRFGAYGNPDTLPLDLVSDLASTAKTWTGYTHNWQDLAKKEYLNFFMASAHQNLPDWQAIGDNVRYFITDGKIGVICPASEEYYQKTGKKATCSKCGLCSGKKGKGFKNVIIASH